MSDLIKVGGHMLNLAAVASAHWEKRKLFVHLIGGRFITLTGEPADLAWAELERAACLVVGGESEEPATV